MLLFVGSACIHSGVAQNTAPEYEDGALYIKFKSQSGISAKKMPQSKDGREAVATSLLGISAQIINRYEIAPEAYPMALFDNEILDQTFRIQTGIKSDVLLEKLIKELEKNPNVEYVERVPFNRIFNVLPAKSKPNDPFYGYIIPDTMNVSWHLDMLNAEKAWELQTGNPNIIVAVVDNAVWGEHEDLQIPANLQFNCNGNNTKPSSSAPPAGVNQNEACKLEQIMAQTCMSYNFSHGTHCAGAIAAISNNGKGIASIGNGVTLMGVGGPDIRYPNNIINSYGGLKLAANNGAKVISCSWGSLGKRNATDEQLVKTCYEKGIIIVAAAGNDNSNEFHSPSGYHPYVISVGSVDADGNKSSFSNYGPWVDILSPGGDDVLSPYQTMIFSTTYCQNQFTRLWGKHNNFEGAYYDEMHGTSMATPVLAGVISLMVSMDSTLTTDEIRNILQRTGNPIGRGYDSRFNEYCKIADAYAALKFIKDGFEYGPAIPRNDFSATTAHDTVWLEWKAPDTDLKIKGYKIYAAGDIIADTLPEPDSLDRYHFAISGLTPGFIRLAVEPVYENLYAFRTETDIEIKTYYTIRATIRPDTTYGYVEGSGKYEKNTYFSLTAIPREGYKFVYWKDGTNMMYNPIIEELATQNRAIFAWFEEATPNENLSQLEQTLTISPNPASDEITVRCPDFEIQHIRITDLQGKTVYDADCRTNTQTINIQSWAKGTYMVQVETQGGTVSQKLIKR